MSGVDGGGGVGNECELCHEGALMSGRESMAGGKRTGSQLLAGREVQRGFQGSSLSVLGFPGLCRRTRFTFVAELQLQPPDIWKPHLQAHRLSYFLAFMHCIYEPKRW